MQFSVVCVGEFGSEGCVLSLGPVALHWLRGLVQLG
jgi:hypothetical protein